MIPEAPTEVPIEDRPTVFDHVAEWKGALLEALSRGPRPVDHLPRRWPMTRQVNSILIRELVAEGLVEYERRPKQKQRVRLSVDGRLAA